MRVISATITFLTLCLALSAQQAPPKENQSICPAHDMRVSLNERAEKGMGFSQSATTHHFMLTSTGGVIQVEANDSADTANRENIRMHLHHIVRAFQSGDFDIPMFVHDTVPPGALVMKERAKQIRFSIEQTPNGGRVLIRTADKDALQAIHNFLRFQITEHRTGDPLSVP
jgi:hypothetical protein